MKHFYVLCLSALFLFSACSSDDSNNATPTPETRAYVDKIVSTNSNGATELRFIYDTNNRLIRNETDTYFRDYTYSGNRITKIESITAPSTPYYQIQFAYDSQGRVTEVKRDNFHNNTVYYVTYSYDASNRVNVACTYNSIADYNLGNCERFYNFTYIGNSTNYEAKSLTVTNLNGADILEVSTWAFDTHERPYFGDAIDAIQLPYATDGTGMDWEHLYNTNNPLAKYIFDVNTNENKLRRSYNYQYNNDDMPTQLTVNTYDTFNGTVSSTFSQSFTYITQ